jgi:prophage antirepressor-like protein
LTEISNVFHFDDHDVRTVIIDGEPWFVASDICSAIGLSNTSQAVSYLDNDETQRIPAALITSEGRAQDSFLVVNEPGMYSLILRSRKAEAKAFKRWITHVVIPAIRKTGRFEIVGSSQPAIAADAETERRAVAARLDLSVIDAMGSIVDPTWRESLARHAWAVYKGEGPDIAPENRMLMAEPYLLERGISKADLGSIRSTFGKRLKAAYVAEYGREPEMTLAMVNGREREVKGYYERDRHLFDAVFAQHYTHLAGPQQLELGAA